MALGGLLLLEIALVDAFTGGAPGGLADYCNRYGGLYATMQQQMKPLEWEKALVDRLHAARRAELPANMQPVRQEWRDRRLMALLAHKAEQPE